MREQRCERPRAGIFQLGLQVDYRKREVRGADDSRSAGARRLLTRTSGAGEERRQLGFREETLWRQRSAQVEVGGSIE